MKSLIIAEKPSVAADLARVLGKIKKTGDHYEDDQWVIASAVGHLVELYMPEDIDPKLRMWRLAALPILPDGFQLKPIEKTKSKFAELKKLMARKDIGRVINACDAGREGELIFAYIYQLAGKKLPVERLWMSSMTPQAILDAFSSLRPGESLKPLEHAARSRSESDWLVGINGTRAVTLRLYGMRARQVATVGRVQTPTLALVVQRELEIRNFKPQDYWRIVGRFGIESGKYEGVYQRSSFSKDPQNAHDRADRIWTKSEADRVFEEVKNAASASITETLKRTRQIAPRLYDLTTLQREANNRFGFPSGMTLKIAQSLYESHKVLTYPRTDSRALPQDYPETCAATLASLVEPYDGFASHILKKGLINPKDRRVFDNRQVSDHFAIIPTTQKPKNLKPEEQKIYDMVTRRFLAVFYPAAEFDVTTRITTVAGHAFKTEGKVLVDPGWMAVYDREQAKEATIPPLRAADKDGSAWKGSVEDISLEAEVTKPPARYTEATLLSAMEGAGKLVEDEDLADAMKEKGLGTPATRAATIDHLIRENYMVREGRDLSPTAKAEELMRFLTALGVEELTSPALTGEWEYRLRQVEQGKLSREQFMEGILNLTRKIVDSARGYEEKAESLKESSIVSPSDGQPMLESMRAYKSRDGLVTLYKTIGNRQFSEAELSDLVQKGEIGPLDGFRSKVGKPYSATIKLDADFKPKFVFANGNGNGNGSDSDEANGNGSPVDLTSCPVVGTSPVDGTPVYETPQAFICETQHKGGKGFRLGRTMLGKTLPREQVAKLLKDGATEVIQGFRSKKTGRLFSASLHVDKSGKISFQFPPREKKAGSTSAKGKKAATSAGGDK